MYLCVPDGFFAVVDTGEESGIVIRGEALISNRVRAKKPC